MHALTASLCVQQERLQPSSFWPGTDTPNRIMQLGALDPPAHTLNMEGRTNPVQDKTQVPAYLISVIIQICIIVINITGALCIILLPFLLIVTSCMPASRLCCCLSGCPCCLSCCLQQVDRWQDRVSGKSKGLPQTCNALQTIGVGHTIRYHCSKQTTVSIQSLLRVFVHRVYRRTVIPKLPAYLGG